MKSSNRKKKDVFMFLAPEFDTKRAKYLIFIWSDFFMPLQEAHLGIWRRLFYSQIGKHLGVLVGDVGHPFNGSGVVDAYAVALDAPQLCKCGLW
jgi:hypothetical protein